MNASRCGLPPRPNSIVQKYRERAAASKKDKGCSFDIMMGHGPRQSRPFLSETFDRAKLAKCKAYKSMQHRTQGEEKYDPFTKPGIADLMSVPSEIGGQKSLARSRSSAFNPAASEKY